MSSLVVNNVIKPPLWVPGRSPLAGNLWQGCVLCLPLWEGVGTAPGDVSPYPNSTSGWHANLAWSRCIYGAAPLWDGDEEFVVDDAPHLQCDTQVSVLAAITSDDLESVGNAIAHVVSKWNGFVLRYGDSTKAVEIRGIGFTVFDGGTTYDAFAGAVSTNSPHVWAGTYDGATIRVYEDGLQVASTARVGDIDTGADPIYIGNYVDGGFEFVGHIALLAIWNRALSPGEIAVLAADPFIMIRLPGG